MRPVSPTGAGEADSVRQRFLEKQKNRKTEKLDWKK
jgi:hypothetical protein